MIANPREAIRAAANFELPPTVDISVFEDTPESLCLVVTAPVSGERSDADLAGVAGGANSNDDGIPEEWKAARKAELL